MFRDSRSVILTSSSDYAYAQWIFMLHVLVTRSPNGNKCWVTLAIYGIPWGWCHWPITIQHLRAQWGSVVSWRACSIGSEKAALVPRSIRISLSWLKIYWQFLPLIKMHALLMSNINMSICGVVKYNLIRVSLDFIIYSTHLTTCDSRGTAVNVLTSN